MFNLLDLYSYFIIDMQHVATHVVSVLTPKKVDGEISGEGGHITGYC